jgi:hypothetical protein
MTIGTASEAIAAYQHVGGGCTPCEPHAVADGILSREARITSVTCHDASGAPAAVFRTGASAKVRVSYVVHSPVRDAVFEIYLYSVVDRFAGLWCQITTASYNGLGIPLEPGMGTVEFEVDEIGLQPGMYYLSATIVRTEQAIGTGIDSQTECLTLRIDPGRFVQGTFYMPHRWQLTPGPASSSDEPECVAESIGP